MSETWPEYLRRITGGQTQTQIAERIGIGRLSVCNWLRGKTRPKAGTAITVARAYQRPPLEALVAASYLKAVELAGPVEIRNSPRDLSADDIAKEVHRRLTTLEQMTSEQ
jgi:transcriptional regulator with XRE-family HTH domain